jgi:hypothetical protein
MEQGPVCGRLDILASALLQEGRGSSAKQLLNERVLDGVPQLAQKVIVVQDARLKMRAQGWSTLSFLYLMP